MKLVVAQFNSITYDLEVELLKRGHTIEHMVSSSEELKKMDVLVTWNEVHQYGNHLILEKANKLGVGTVLMQHGRRGTSRIYPPFNEKLVCKKVCVWSENDKKRLMSVGTPEDRIVVTGTPALRHLKPRVPHKGINVVFSPEHWGQEVVENNIVAGTLRRIKGINVITKCLVNEHSFELYDNVVVSDRNTPEHLDIVADVLSKADVVVCLNEGTMELCAEILDIPVILADIWMPKPLFGDSRYETHRREISPACTRVKDMSKLGEAIMYAVEHPEYLREERKKIAIDDGGMDIPNPIERIIEVIEDAGRHKKKNNKR